MCVSLHIFAKNLRYNNHISQHVMYRWAMQFIKMAVLNKTHERGHGLPYLSLQSSKVIIQRMARPCPSGH